MDKFVTMSSKKRAPEPKGSEPNEKDDVRIEGAKKKPSSWCSLSSNFFPQFPINFCFIFVHIIDIII